MRKVVSALCAAAMLVTSICSASAGVIGMERNGKLNSWRFTNGVPNNAGLASSGASSAWQWTDDGFLNDCGEIIENASMKGIDVSEWNHTINWEKVAETDVDYAIIRVGYGSDFTSQDDKYVQQNIRGCVEYGIPFGVYIYSYAENVSMAKSEADHTLRVLKTVHDNIVDEVGEYDLNFPVFYDMEDEYVQAYMSPAKLGELAKAFCTKIRQAGYEVGIYANLNWWNNHLTDSYFSSDFLCKWVAQYNSYCYYQKPYDMWQCTSTGYVSGISGGVDFNFWYHDYVTIDDYARNTSISLDKKTCTVSKDSTTKKVKLKANVFSPTGNNTVTWATNNKNVATVSNSGVVTVKSRGKCTITATVNDGSKKKAKCDLTVKQLVTKVVLNKKQVTLAKKGKKAQIKVTVKPTNANKPKVKWTSTKSSIATVNQNGYVTAKKKGVCYIKAASTDGSNNFAKCKITVKK